MALFRQGSGPYPAGVAPPGSGDHRPGSPFRLHDHVKADQKVYVGLVRSRSMKKKPGRSGRSRKCSIGAIIVVLLVGVVVTIFGADYVFPLMRNLKAEVGDSSLPDPTDQGGLSVSKEGKSVSLTYGKGNEETARSSGRSAPVDKAEVKLKENTLLAKTGKICFLTMISMETWMLMQNTGKTMPYKERQSSQTKLEDEFETLPSSYMLVSESNDIKIDQIKETKPRGEYTVIGGFYNERDPKELFKHEKHSLDASLNKDFHSFNNENKITDMKAYHGQKGSFLVEGDSDLDGREESRDTQMNHLENGSSHQELQYKVGDDNEIVHDEDVVESFGRVTDTTIDTDKSEIVSRTSMINITSKEATEDEDPDGSVDSLSEYKTFRNGEDPRLVDFLREVRVYAHKTDPSLNVDCGDGFEDNSDYSAEPFIGTSKNTSSAIAGDAKEELKHQVTTHDDEMSRVEDGDEEQMQQEQLSGKSTKKKSKRTVPPCEISFSNSTKGLREPTDNSRFESFSLTYRQREEKSVDDPLWEPRFAGHQTLSERRESFLAKDQEDLHCGFVRGPKSYQGTGFEISKEDMDYLQTCHIAVSSCIFGNYDHIRTPSGKKVTSASKKKVCFAMFVDQLSLDGMKEEGDVPDENMNLGLWRIVLIKNVPYSDNRRTGKVPKFLTHRLFPNARYSVWLDSKLRLQSDPLLILEYFLWRGHHEYAISNHYDRHCVWEEVEQNKKLNKYNHSVIDEQFAFYQADGLTRFNASDLNRLLPSHVPEGSFIVRAHTPMSNLFSCLWFNEVDRFTPRDQLSFAYTYMKFVRSNPNSRFRLNMFKDCERKAIAKLYRHKTEDVLGKGRRH